MTSPRPCDEQTEAAGRRVRDVVLLLGSLEDVLPAPRTWTGQLVARSSTRGAAPARWQECIACRATGTTRDRFARESPCLVCGGAGRVRVDDYTGERVGTLTTAAVSHLTTVRCDACGGEGCHGNGRRCTWCRGSGRRTVTPDLAAAHGGDQTTAGFDLWGGTGSYHELDRLLARMHVIAVRTHRFIWTVHVSRIRNEPSLTREERWASACGLEWLAYWMPSQILLPHGLAKADAFRQAQLLTLNGRSSDRHAVAARDQEIRKLDKQGKPVQWIAQQSHLSLRRVYEIVNGIVDVDAGAE